jgi:hypothetical protein
MKLLRQFGRKLRGPVWLMLVLSVVLLLFSLYATHQVRAYNSDDVSWQNIVHDWQPFSGEKVTLGSSNNFVGHVPFMALTEALFPSGRSLILLQSAFFAVLGFVLFYFSALYFMRRVQVKPTYITLLPFLWFASFGYSYNQLFLNPQWRGAGPGLSFAIFALVAMFLNKEVSLKPLRSKLGFVVVGLIAGITSFSDPYFIYFTVATLTIFVTLLYAFKKIQRAQLLIVYGGVGLSFLFAKATEIISSRAGITMAESYPSSFVSFDRLGQNISAAFEGMLHIFGADFFGEKAASLVAVSAVLNVVILGFITYTIWQQRTSAASLQKKTTDQGRLWLLFFAGICVFVVAAYIMSTLASIATYRYFIMVVFTGVFLLAVAMGSMKKYWSLWPILLVAATIGNVALSATHHQSFLQPGSLNNKANQVNYQIIDAVQSRQLTKGYADFWQGIINTYLSRDQVEFLPTLCPDRPVKFHWLVNEDSFTKPATKSFFIVDPDIAAQQICTPEQLQTAFGEPTEVLHVTNKTIYIYDYDITNKIP